MQEYYRPYSIILKGDDATASGITLKDSGGTALECNYLSITASGTGNTGYFRAMPIPKDPLDADILTTAYAQTATAAASLIFTAPASGVVGQYASTLNGSMDFVMSDTDRFDTVYIQQSDASDTLYMLTYGYVKGPSNPLRGFDRPTGK
jgi:hypothetical protein|tara:strand:- start:2988 stop:3434 length:447 start_codon:yes stop_codon:yes gene_type:complete